MPSAPGLTAIGDVDGKFQIGVATNTNEISRQQEIDNLASAIGVN
jgi:hypothetical protein